MASHIVGFEVGVLVFLVHNIHHVGCDLIGHVLNMSPTLYRIDSIYKADLYTKFKLN